MQAIRKLHLSILSFCLLLLATTVACAETGVTDSEIRIGMWTPLSGPVALLGQSARDAVRLWAKEVNDKGASTAARSISSRMTMPPHRRKRRRRSAG
jgi:hypothetical protein